MGFTAFVHASVAYPNTVGQPSQILKDWNGKTFLENVLSACLNASQIDHIVVVTSDNALDDKLVEISQAFLINCAKNAHIHRISSDKNYSFQYKKEQMRDIAFPYMWMSTHGAFTLEGLNELANFFKTQNAVILDADQCVFADAKFMDHFCEQVKGKLVCSRYVNPYREIYAFNVQFLNDLSKRHKNKIESKLVEKSFISLVRDIVFFAEDDSMKFMLPMTVNNTANFYPLYREHDCRLLNFFNESDVRQCISFADRFLKEQTLGAVDYLEVFLSEGSETEVIKKKIKEFALCGTALNFICDNTTDIEVLSDVIGFAKNNGVISVWCEWADISDRGEKIVNKLISCGLDLLIITANSFLNKLNDLESLIEQFNDCRKTKGGHFPFIAIEYVASPWITTEADIFIKKFEKVADRVFIRAVKDSDSTEIPRRNLDFAPLHRLPCRKLFNGFYILKDGSAGICERDLTGYFSKYDFKSKTLSEMQMPEIKKRIFEEQCAEKYGESFGACTDCKVWYIKNLAHNFSDIMFRRDFCAVEHLLNNSTDIEALIEKVESFVKTVSLVRKDLFEQINLFQSRVAREQDVLYKGIISQHVTSLHRRASLFDLFKTKLRKLYIPLGDALISEAKYEQGLDIWERVLKYDPSNAYIHGRLDEMLEEADKNEYSTT